MLQSHHIKKIVSVTNDNPLEQFDHWLNDAIHSDEYEPTAMTVALDIIL